MLILKTIKNIYAMKSTNMLAYFKKIDSKKNTIFLVKVIPLLKDYKT